MARNGHKSTPSLVRTPRCEADSFVTMSHASTSGRRPLVRTLAVTESEHPASATTRHLVHNADYELLRDLQVRQAGRDRTVGSGLSVGPPVRPARGCKMRSSWRCAADRMIRAGAGVHCWRDVGCRRPDRTAPLEHPLGDRLRIVHIRLASRRAWRLPGRSPSRRTERIPQLPVATHSLYSK